MCERRLAAKLNAICQFHRRNSHDPIFVYFTENQLQRFGRVRTSPKTQGGASWTGSLAQDFDWLPISIEPDRLIRGIIDHKPNSFSERDDPLRKAIEHCRTKLTSR